MPHILVTEASMVKDGITIALTADSLEERKRALEATLRVTRRLQQSIQDEIKHLETP